MMYEIELGYSNDEIKEKLKSLSVPENVIETLFYKDKNINFLIFIAICLLLLGTLILIIIT